MVVPNEVSIGGVDGRDTKGGRSLKRDVKKSAVEFGEVLTLLVHSEVVPIAKAVSRWLTRGSK